MSQLSLRNNQSKSKTSRKLPIISIGILGICLESMKKNRKITTQNWLALANTKVLTNFCAQNLPATDCKTLEPVTLLTWHYSHPYQYSGDRHYSVEYTIIQTGCEEYFAKCCHFHKTLLWIWIMLCKFVLFFYVSYVPCKVAYVSGVDVGKVLVFVRNLKCA